MKSARFHFLIYLIFSFCLFAFRANAQNNDIPQTIVILNGLNQEPVEGAIVREEQNPSNLAISDQKGRVNINQFGKDTHLLIQHLGFEPLIIPLSEIIQKGGQVSLEENVLSLNEIVLSANKWEQEKKHIPNQIVGIPPQDIAFKSPQTTADMLHQTGQVFVQKSQQGGGSPMIRGFAANSVLIVVDGVRMNNAIYRSGNLQNVIALDANILESAEVVFGPGSVMYGSDALGGVMDFHTKKPSYSNNGKLLVEGSLLSRFASANNEITGHADVNISGKNWSLLSSITYSDFDDLRSGSNRPNAHPDFGKRLDYVDRINGEDVIITNLDENSQKYSGYEQLNLMNKLGLKVSPYIDLTYSFHYSATSDVPRYDRLIERRNGNLRNAAWYYSPQTWQLHALTTNVNKQTNFFDRLKNTFAYQNVAEGRNDRRFGSQQLRERVEKVDVFSWNLDAEKDLLKNIELFYGLEFTHNQVNSSAFSTNIETGQKEKTSTRYPDGGSTLSTAALYSSAKYLVSEKTTLSAGIRYNQIWINASFNDKSFFPFPYETAELNTGSLNGSLGLTHRPSKNTQFNFNLSTGFRAPNIDDIGKVFDSEPGVVVVPNPDLKPENAYNAEVGVSQVIASKIKVEATVFYSYLKDALVRRPFTFNGEDSLLYDGTMSQVQALTNTGRAFVWGISTALQFELTKNIFFKGTLNYTDGEDLEDGLPLRHVAPLFGQLALNYKKEKWQASIFSDFNGSIAFEDLAPSEQNKTDFYTADGSLSWITLNARASYRLWNNLYLQAALENITDLHYRPYSSGISAAGRNFRVSARFSF